MTDSNVHIRSNDKAYLLVRNPSSVFVCWTWSPSSVEAFGSAAYAPEITVRLAASDDKGLVVESTARWDSGGVYLRPPAEGRLYSASVFAVKNDGSKEKLLESNQALTPVSSYGQGGASGYASSEFFRKETGI